ncbi:MAG: EamA family transporter [Clostridia bacterium]|nr:EamA family transporter [Clostridia bacterium]
MGYILAFIAIFFALMKGFCGKKISDYTARPEDAAYYNFIRMLLCILIGAALVVAEGTGFKVSVNVLIISALSGIALAVMVISWLMAARKSVYMLVDVYCTLSVAIPLTLSAIFYKEKVDLYDAIGLVLLVLSTYLIAGYSASTKKQKLKLHEYGILFLVFLSIGFTNFLQKVFIKNSQGESVTVFNFYTYVFAAAVLFVFLLVTNKNKTGEKAKRPIKAYILVCFMAIALFLNSLFATLAAGKLTSAELYPLTQGSTLALAPVMAALFFGEKPKPRLIVGIVLCFSGLIIMNVLK